jgi:hypothetical protein
MVGARVHFEVYVRSRPGASWALEMATENRTAAVDTAKQLMQEGKIAAVKVTKETMDDETREFQTVTIFKDGAVDSGKAEAARKDVEPLCVTPQDLYTIHARERIGRLLEDWLNRNHATAFELLHRPDLVEQLETSGTELQHAVQKIAIPEAQNRGISVHEIIRVFNALIERTIDRLLTDFRKGALPDVDKEGFAATAERLSNAPEKGYLLGAGVAASIAPARGWAEKVGRLLDLADAAPKKPSPARTLALATIAQPLAELLGAKPALDDILGKGLDMGGNLAAMTRLAAASAVDSLIKIEPSVAKVMPPLSPNAMRLAGWLEQEEFSHVRAAIGRRILRELNGPRRLRPGDAAAEIDVLRALAMSLTAAAGSILPLDDVQSAFSARSRMLVTGDFVEAYLGVGKSSRQEADALVWLTENVIGAANKRSAGRWLQAVVASLRFEKEVMAATGDTAAVRLASLAVLQRAVGACGLVDDDCDPIKAKLGVIGGLIESQAGLTRQLAKANAPAVQRLTLLLKLAGGESAPLGPAADRARVEAVKLIRQDDVRAELSQAPIQAEDMRDLIQRAGLAA